MKKHSRVIAFAIAGSMLVVGRAAQITSAPPLTPLETAVKEAYAREFNEPIERPAIHNDPTSGGCKGREPSLTTTAYVKTSPTTARLLYLYTTSDGGAVTRKADVASVVIPAGTFRVLVIIVGHPATVRKSDLANVEAAQAKINEDHVILAKNIGLPKPVVSFDNTNVLVDPVDIANPSAPSSVRDNSRAKRICAGVISVRRVDQPRSGTPYARGKR